MAVTITPQNLITELRLGDSLEELELATRRLAYASEEVIAEAEGATDACHNEACIRLASFIYDQPTSSPDNRYANALKSSGAQRVLSRYKTRQAPVIRADLAWPGL